MILINIFFLFVSLTPNATTPSEHLTPYTPSTCHAR